MLLLCVSVGIDDRNMGTSQAIREPDIVQRTDLYAFSVRWFFALYLRYLPVIPIAMKAKRFEHDHIHISGLE